MVVQSRCPPGKASVQLAVQLVRGKLQLAAGGSTVSVYHQHTNKFRIADLVAG